MRSGLFAPKARRIISLDDLVGILRSRGYQPTFATRGRTSRGWRYFAECSEDLHHEFLLLMEKNTDEVLYIAFDGRHAVFHRFESVFEAMDTSENLRIPLQIMLRIMEEANGEG